MRNRYSMRPDGTAAIYLNNGGEVLINGCDLSRVAPYLWFGVTDHGIRYAYAHHKKPGGQDTTIKMHRLIMLAKDWQMIDHKDGDGLNNLRSNLRVATREQNQHNSGPVRSKQTTSAYKGVSRSKIHKARPWVARIRAYGKVRHIGQYATEEEAARAWDAAAVKYHGEFARFNFPYEPPQAG